MKRLGILKGGKKRQKSGVVRWKGETDAQSESEGAKGGGRCTDNISGPNQVDFKVTRCQSTAGLINSPLAGIIVQAAFEIHQRNVDLL